MKVFRSTFIGLVLSFFIANASATVPMNDYLVPYAVSIFVDGTLEVIFNEEFNTACTHGGIAKMYVKAGTSIGVTSDSIKPIQSFVLAAYMAGKPIKFLYDRIGSTCYGGQVTLGN